jgi:hypothetical protein
MKKSILLSMILFLTNGACKEEEVVPYKEFFGFYDGYSYAKRVQDVYFCEGVDMEIKDLGDDNVTVSVYCRSWSKESLNKFENLKIGKSKFETVNTEKWSILNNKKQPVEYSLTDTKTGKEVAYFHKSVLTRTNGDTSTQHLFFADSLLSTKGVYLNLYFGQKK